MSTDELELQTKLAKALADADYWRLAYDKLLSRMEQTINIFNTLKNKLGEADEQ